MIRPSGALVSLKNSRVPTASANRGHALKPVKIGDGFDVGFVASIQNTSVLSLDPLNAEITSVRPSSVMLVPITISRSSGRS